MNQKILQNLKLINEFLLAFKLLDKTRTLYGIPSGNIFIKSIKQSIKSTYEEFQLTYVEQLYGPFSVLQKLEDVEMMEHAFGINKGILDLLNSKQRDHIEDIIPNSLIVIEEGFSSLARIPDFRELEETMKSNQINKETGDFGVLKMQRENEFSSIKESYHLEYVPSMKGSRNHSPQSRLRVVKKGNSDIKQLRKLEGIRKGNWRTEQKGSERYRLENGPKRHFESLR